MSVSCSSGFFISCSLHFTCSEYVWELYNVDCKLMPGLIQNHDLCGNISGDLFSLYSLLVVEFDLPWDDSQVSQYGDSFKAWSADEFKGALNAVLQTMPYNAIAIVVSLLFRL